jgi:molybdopterin/thiamine biosynthesis adenylyltransferase
MKINIFLNYFHQFYRTENDIGKNRAECSYQYLLQLNPYVSIKNYTTSITKEYIQNNDFQVIYF